MNESDSDSEDFQSADEYVESEDDCKNNVVETTLKESSGLLKDTLETAGDNVITTALIHPVSDVLSNSPEECTQPITYRKLPERTKRIVASPLVPNKVEKIPAITKVARPDVIIKDINSYVTSGITKGLSTFQETSSSIKGLVLGSAPHTDEDSTTKFNYDDDRGMPSLQNERSALPPEDALIKSALNDEILKLSSAFARLNAENSQRAKSLEPPVSLTELADIGIENIQNRALDVNEAISEGGPVADEKLNAAKEQSNKNEVTRLLVECSDLIQETKFLPEAINKTSMGKTIESDNDDGVYKDSLDIAGNPANSVLLKDNDFSMVPEESVDDTGAWGNWGGKNMDGANEGTSLLGAEFSDLIPETAINKTSIGETFEDDDDVCGVVEKPANSVLLKDNDFSMVPEESGEDTGGWGDWGDENIDGANESSKNPVENTQGANELAAANEGCSDHGAGLTTVSNIIMEVNKEANTYEKNFITSQDKTLVEEPSLEKKTLEEANADIGMTESEKGWGDLDDEEITKNLRSLNNTNNLIALSKGYAGKDCESAKKLYEAADDGWGDWGDEPEVEKERQEESGWGDFEEFPPSEGNDNKGADGWGDWGDYDEDMVSDLSYSKKELTGEQAVKQPAERSESHRIQQDNRIWDTFGEKKSERGGWGFSSLLNTATAVTSNISALTQGISSVIESGLGVPDPETMARLQQIERNERVDRMGETPFLDAQNEQLGHFPFRNIAAGVGKIVEVAKVQEIGSRVLSSGLDTLETIGKKTMEVLQEGDPGLKKKRALLVGKGQTLSNVLKEARDRSAAEDRKAGERAAGRRYHFETVFDDFQGLVHLEALEMLSMQCQLRIEQLLQSMSSSKASELQDTLEEVKQLCELDEDYEAVESDNFRNALFEAVEHLQNEFSVAKIIEVHEKLTKWLENGAVLSSSSGDIYDKAISAIAELTASATQQFHKGGELLLLKERRKTVEEAECLLQLTGHLSSEIVVISERFANILEEKKDQKAELLVGNLRVEADNAVAYIKQALGLLLPVIQLGAV